DGQSSLRRLHTGLHGHSCFGRRRGSFWHRISLSTLGRDSILSGPSYLWSHGAASLQSSSGHGLWVCDGCHGYGDDRVVLSSDLLSRLLSSRVLSLLRRSLLRVGERKRLWSMGVTPPILVRGLTTTITVALTARRPAGPTPIMQREPREAIRV